jgi:hypothetical protein
VGKALEDNANGRTVLSLGRLWHAAAALHFLISHTVVDGEVQLVCVRLELFPGFGGALTYYECARQLC